jgi:hypothetical protein
VFPSWEAEHRIRSAAQLDFAEIEFRKGQFDAEAEIPETGDSWPRRLSRQPYSRESESEKERDNPEQLPRSNSNHRHRDLPRIDLLGAM